MYSYYLLINKTIPYVYFGLESSITKYKINVIAKNGAIVIVGTLLNVNNQIGGGGGISGFLKPIVKADIVVN